MYPHGDFDWKDGGHLAFLTWEPGSDIEIPTPETGTICQCGLALCYHRGDNPLAYRRNECMGYQPRYTQRELDRNDPSIYFKGDTDKPCCGNR